MPPTEGSGREANGVRQRRRERRREAVFWDKAGVRVRWFSGGATREGGSLIFMGPRGGGTQKNPLLLRQKKGFFLRSPSPSDPRKSGEKYSLPTSPKVKVRLSLDSGEPWRPWTMVVARTRASVRPPAEEHARVVAATPVGDHRSSPARLRPGTCNQRCTLVLGLGCLA